jgi:predicted RNA-binding Zn ribbon-like protein
MPTGRFLFLGERLCLDFVNTEAIADGRHADLLTGFDELVAWSVAAGTISAAQARELITAWTDRRPAERTLTTALAFRSVLREMAEQIASGRRTVSPRILDGINDVLRTRAGHLAIVRAQPGYETSFQARFNEPSDLLVPVAESAAGLLSSGDIALVKKCQNPQCVLYFCDTTKNHARRWCSMTVCGNRAKVAAHYQRARQAKAQD